MTYTDRAVMDGRVVSIYVEPSDPETILLNELDVPGYSCGDDVTEKIDPEHRSLVLDNAAWYFETEQDRDEAAAMEIARQDAFDRRCEEYERRWAA